MRQIDGDKVATWLIPPKGLDGIPKSKRDRLKHTFMALMEDGRFDIDDDDNRQIQIDQRLKEQCWRELHYTRGKRAAIDKLLSDLTKTRGILQIDCNTLTEKIDLCNSKEFPQLKS